jgi:hypothetical protein
MIRKILGILLVVVFAVQNSSCSFKLDGQESRRMFRVIISALENKDKDKLKKLLAPALFDYVKSEDIDSQIDNAFEFFKGHVISYPYINGSSSSMSAENGKQTMLIIRPRVDDIKTSEGTYSVGFNARIVYSDDITTEGLWHITIYKPDGEYCEIGYVLPNY